MKIRLRLPVPAIFIAFAMVFTSPVTGELAAQELSQCYLEGKPCGTPEQLYERITYCLQDANLCRQSSHGADLVARQDNQPTASEPPSASRPGAISSRLAGPSVQTRVPDLVRLKPAQVSHEASTEFSAIGTNAIGTEDRSRQALDDLARDLPLDPVVRDLSDTMPVDAAIVERRLGLRRPRVAGKDMRGRTPSVAEIVQVLAPLGKPRQ